MSIEGFFIVGLIVGVGVLAWCFIQVLIIEIQLQRDMRRIEEKSALAKDLKVLELALKCDAMATAAYWHLHPNSDGYKAIRAAYDREMSLEELLDKEIKVNEEVAARVKKNKEIEEENSEQAA